MQEAEANSGQEEDPAAGCPPSLPLLSLYPSLQPYSGQGAEGRGLLQ